MRRHEMGYGSECARTRWGCGGDNRFISLEPCEVEEEERRASISMPLQARTRPAAVVVRLASKSPVIATDERAERGPGYVL